MNTDNKNKDNRGDSSAAKIAVVIIVNAIIIIAVAAISLNYFFSQIESRYDTEKRNFLYAVGSMEHVAQGYFQSSQAFCSNWSLYIDENNMTLDESMGFLREINSVPEIMAHLIDYDTLSGYSTSSAPNSDNYSVSYAGKNDTVIRLLKEVEHCSQTDEHMHITHAYTNPINAVSSIGFCHDTQITTENGEKKHMLLIRVVPVSKIRNQLVFTTGYENGRISIIDYVGDYVIYPDEFKGDNFFETMRRCNNMTYTEANALKTDILTNDNGIFSCLDSNRQPAVFAYHHAVFNDWIIIGNVAESDMSITPVNLTLVTIVIIGFLLLICFDGGYIFIIHRKLKISMAETKNANEAKTRFLSSMSHDIRIPMNAIIGMTTIATRHIDDSERVKECLRKITLASNHLITLINDILDISKVESGKLSINPSVFSLAETVGNLVNIARSQASGRQLDFDVHVHNIEHEYLYADELRINQIFINLLSNAIKYTPPGGKVVLDIKEEPIEDNPDRIRLIFIVSDTGIGMTEEFMKHMYTSFTRATDSRINSIQGTGLGLAITKQMIDLFEGTIDVKSRLGEGSVFTVKLDLPLAENITDNIVLPPLKLLIVDDDEIFLETTLDAVHSLGMDADTASSGEQAVDLAVRRHIDGNDYPCAIIDWKMPGIDGLETTRRIRNQIGPDIPIIIISSYDWTEIEDEARAAGANAFINKPLFRSTLRTTINELFRTKDNRIDTHEDAEDIPANLNILIAEDNDINWEVISEMLSFYNIKSERAKNGRECVSMLLSVPEKTYDMVFMDVQMPVMNGLDATRAIRASDIDYVKNIPVIAMTADAYAENVAECLNVGMNSHIPKPLDIKKVLKEIKKAVQCYTGDE